MKFDIDLTTVKELKPIPEGAYLMICKDVNSKQSKAGNSMLVYQAEIIEPLEVRNEVDRFFFNMVLTENALFRVKQLFEATGTPITAGSFDATAVLGEQFIAMVTVQQTEEYPDPRNNIARFLKAGQVEPEVTGEWPDAEEAD
jgi:hypothetical protein